MMKPRMFLTAAALAILAAAAPGIVSADISAPEDYFGFRPGEDGKLIDYGQLVSYLADLDENSSRIRMIEAGESPMGRKIDIVFISSPENIVSLERLREINERLALDPDIDDAERRVMVEEGRVFFLATLSMHSGEVAPSQAAPLMAAT